MAMPTPGPWKRDDKSPFLLVAPNGQRILTVGFSTHPSWPSQDEAEANLNRIINALDALAEIEAKSHPPGKH